MNLKSAVFEVSHSVIDFLFPPACTVCGGYYSGAEIICSDCFDMVAHRSFTYCPPQRSLNNIDAVSILLPYDSLCRTMIHALKYHGMHSIGLRLGTLLARKTLRDRSFPVEPLLIPVPLHPSKLLERGYNQSERLAEGFSQFSGFGILSDLLGRSKQTGTQTALDHEQRILNVRNAFGYTGKTSLSGKPVILIDDVLTTGSTVSECGKALKEGGVGEITVCVVATPDIGKD